MGDLIGFQSKCDASWRNSVAMKAQLYRRFESDLAPYSVVFEDDGRVGYAYLIDDTESICGDVWLYNRATAPAEPEWHNADNAPFLNPERYVSSELAFDLPRSEDDINIRFNSEANTWSAEIYIGRHIAGRLTDGAKPGWAVLAKETGPLAQVLVQ